MTPGLSKLSDHLLSTGILTLVVVLIWQRVDITRLRHRSASDDIGYATEQAVLREKLDATKAKELQVLDKLNGIKPDGAETQRRFAAQSMRNARIMELLVQNPEYAGIRKRIIERNMFSSGINRAAIEGLHLSPEATQRLKDILAAPVDAYQAAAAVIVSGGSPAEAQKAQMDAMKQAQDDLKAFLGPDGFQNYRASLARAASANSINTGIGADLADAGMPLTPDQTASLTSALVQSTATFAPDPKTGLPGWVQNILDKAPGLLSPAQIAEVRNYFDIAPRTLVLQQQIVSDARASGEIGSDDTGVIEVRDDNGLDSSINFSPVSKGTK